MDAQKKLGEDIGYVFDSKDLLEEALLAAGASTSSKEIDGLKQGNKRRALVGDAVLRLVVLDEWYPSCTATGKVQSLGYHYTALISPRARPSCCGATGHEPRTGGGR